MQTYLTVFLGLGAFVVSASAWQKFNEPSFPNRSALPHTLVPLRYLFVGSQYNRARLTYLGVSLILYVLFVAPGASFISMLGVEKFPPETWPLLVALVLTGLLPNTNITWINLIEETLRRLVHEWYFVPTGVERTIAIMKDVDFQPPTRLLNQVNCQLREQLLEDLRLPRNSLQYRWARARMLMQVIKLIHAGSVEQLHQSDFELLKDDWNAIQEKYDQIQTNYRALTQDVTARGGSLAEAQEDTLGNSITDLLAKMYRYISWGIRYQAKSKQAAEERLEDLGFHVPDVPERQMVDILIPTVFLVAVITMMFSLVMDYLSSGASSELAEKMSRSVVNALCYAMAAALMYGWCVYIALHEREKRIERKFWRRGPAKYIPIAAKAGLSAWLVIVISSVLWQGTQMIPALVTMVHSLKGGLPGVETLPEGDGAFLFLLSKVAMPFPWLLAGATLGIIIAMRMAGDVRRTKLRNRLADAVMVGAAMALATSAAQVIQSSVEQILQGQGHFGSLLSTGLAGFACGGLVGFLVPQLGKSMIVSPPNPENANALKRLLGQATKTFGDEKTAEDWVFKPHRDLGDVSPAEAIGYKERATGIRRLLDEIADSRLVERLQATEDRIDPLVIQRGVGMRAES